MVTARFRRSAKTRHMVIWVRLNIFYMMGPRNHFSCKQPMRSKMLAMGHMGHISNLGNMTMATADIVTMAIGMEMGHLGGQ